MCGITFLAEAATQVSRTFKQHWHRGLWLWIVIWGTSGSSGNYVWEGFKIDWGNWSIIVVTVEFWRCRGTADGHFECITIRLWPSIYIHIKKHLRGRSNSIGPWRRASLPQLFPNRSRGLVASIREASLFWTKRHRSRKEGSKRLPLFEQLIKDG